jgi:hypothetical protein
MRRKILTLLIGLFGTIGVMTASAHAQTTSANSSAAAPSVTVSAPTGPVGASVTVNGTDFMPNFYAVVDVTRPDGSTDMTFAPTDANGNFSWSAFLSPASGTGTETVSAFDYTTDIWNSTSISVTPAVSSAVQLSPGSETLQLSSASVTPGSTVTVNGTGFSASNDVYVSWTTPSGAQGSAVVATDSNGDFSLPLSTTTADGTGSEAIYAIDYGTMTTTAAVLLTVAS